MNNNANLSRLCASSEKEWWLDVPTTVPSDTTLLSAALKGSAVSYGNFEVTRSSCAMQVVPSPTTSVAPQATSFCPPAETSRNFAGGVGGGQNCREYFSNLSTCLVEGAASNENCVSTGARLNVSQAVLTNFPASNTETVAGRTRARSSTTPGSNSPSIAMPEGKSACCYKQRVVEEPQPTTKPPQIRKPPVTKAQLKAIAPPVSKRPTHGSNSPRVGQNFSNSSTGSKSTNFISGLRRLKILLNINGVKEELDCVECGKSLKFASMESHVYSHFTASPLFRCRLCAYEGTSSSGASSHSASHGIPTYQAIDDQRYLHDQALITIARRCFPIKRPHPPPPRSRSPSPPGENEREKEKEDREKEKEDSEKEKRDSEREKEKRDNRERLRKLIQTQIIRKRVRQRLAHVFPGKKRHYVKRRRLRFDARRRPTEPVDGARSANLTLSIVRQLGYPAHQITKRHLGMLLEAMEIQFLRDRQLTVKCALCRSVIPSTPRMLTHHATSHCHPEYMRGQPNRDKLRDELFLMRMVLLCYRSKRNV